jgi:hypothetical protein
MIVKSMVVAMLLFFGSLDIAAAQTSGAPVALGGSTQGNGSGQPNESGAVNKHYFLLDGTTFTRLAVQELAASSYLIAQEGSVWSTSFRERLI